MQFLFLFGGAGTYLACCWVVVVARMQGASLCSLPIRVVTPSSRRCGRAVHPGGWAFFYSVRRRKRLAPAPHTLER